MRRPISAYQDLSAGVIPSDHTDTEAVKFEPATISEVCD